MKKSKILFLVAMLALCVVACGPKVRVGEGASHEDLTAKELMQGIWLDADDENVAFRVAGDTIYYPDSTSQPVQFRIVRDTIVLHAAQTVKYPIVKQSEHILRFQNQYGEVVSLVKSENSEDMMTFVNVQPVAINQNPLIKRDSVVFLGQQRFHTYTQVNPTTYRVVKTVINEDGLAVDNVFFDNIVNLTIYRDASRLFSSDFRKDDFAAYVPESYLAQTILSDITLERTDAERFHYQAILAIPDSPTSYVVAVTIGVDGSVSKSVVE